ncbi:hypothetical protein SAMN05421831_101253 [Allopseudospirillum japonicum]|uniref:Uncharacterized protein n=1 Tax=Allopseudospirillum japonicum TaxID=64971 RepID=A0A1H6QF50_9GAMM|nr:hypothetical protein [Allopseudospirillum japonicum]SEI39574.1 hypothetical protein SAMN05421831_101253 [Allopseudospirillum japonicum]
MLVNHDWMPTQMRHHPQVQELSDQLQQLEQDLSRKRQAGDEQGFRITYCQISSVQQRLLTLLSQH